MGIFVVFFLILFKILKISFRPFLTPRSYIIAWLLCACQWWHSPRGKQKSECWGCSAAANGSGHHVAKKKYHPERIPLAHHYQSWQSRWTLMFQRKAPLGYRWGRRSTQQVDRELESQIQALCEKGGKGKSGLRNYSAEGMKPMR